MSYTWDSTFSLFGNCLPSFWPHFFSSGAQGWDQRHFSCSRWYLFWAFLPCSDWRPVSAVLPQETPPDFLTTIGSVCNSWWFDGYLRCVMIAFCKLTLLFLQKLNLTFHFFDLFLQLIVLGLDSIILASIVDDYFGGLLVQIGLLYLSAPPEGLLLDNQWWVVFTKFMEEYLMPLARLGWIEKMCCL